MARDQAVTLGILVPTDPAKVLARAGSVLGMETVTCQPPIPGPITCIMRAVMKFPWFTRRLAPRLDNIDQTLARIIKMSETTQQAVDHVTSAVASLKAGVSAVLAKVSDLQSQIAALTAAGSGATPEQIAALEASATEIENDVKALNGDPNPPPA